MINTVKATNDIDVPILFLPILLCHFHFKSFGFAEYFIAFLEGFVHFNLLFHPFFRQSAHIFLLRQPSLIHYQQWKIVQLKMRLLLLILRIYHRIFNIFHKERKIFIAIKLISLLANNIQEDTAHIPAAGNTQEDIDSPAVDSTQEDIVHILKEFIDPKRILVVDNIEDGIVIDPACGIATFAVDIVSIVDVEKVIAPLVVVAKLDESVD
jgi:hypothetical protein